MGPFDSGGIMGVSYYRSGGETLMWLYLTSAQLAAVRERDRGRGVRIVGDEGDHIRLDVYSTQLGQTGAYRSFFIEKNGDVTPITAEKKVRV